MAAWIRAKFGIWRRKLISGVGEGFSTEAVTGRWRNGRMPFGFYRRFIAASILHTG